MYVSSTTIESEARLRAICESVNVSLYDNNLTFEIDALSSKRYRLKVGAKDSFGAGTRVSWSRRHGKWACWHAFRDVLAGVFIFDPEAKVKTSMAHYIGANGFLANYPGTADQNIGSVAQPAYMDELCKCDESAKDLTFDLARGL